MIERPPKLSSRRYIFWSQLLSGRGSKMTRYPAREPQRSMYCGLLQPMTPVQHLALDHRPGHLPRHRRRRRTARRSAGPCDRTPDRTRARYARPRSRSAADTPARAVAPPPRRSSWPCAPDPAPRSGRGRARIRCYERAPGSPSRTRPRRRHAATERGEDRRPRFVQGTPCAPLPVRM